MASQSSSRSPGAPWMRSSETCAKPASRARVGGRDGGARRVAAVERRQHVAGRALHAEREPGRARGAERAQGGGVDGVGVRLDGDLGARCARQRGEQPRELLDREQRRRPAADEHRRGGRRAAQHALRERPLGEDRVDVALAPHALARHVGVEVAVAAAARAERHVDVEAERPRPEAGERVRGQGAVGRRRLAVGQSRAHPRADGSAQAECEPGVQVAAGHRAGELEARDHRVALARRARVLLDEHEAVAAAQLARRARAGSPGRSSASWPYAP